MVLGGQSASSIDGSSPRERILGKALRHYSDRSDDYARELLLLFLSHTPVSFDASRSRIQRDLIPWLLGYRDPVAERVAARERGEA